MDWLIKILKDAIEAVPSVKYALGIAGIVSVIAIIASFSIDYRVAIIGTIIMFFLMVMLVIFAKLSSIETSSFKLPAFVLTWFSLILSVAIASLLFTSVFFEWPLPLKFWLIGSSNDIKVDKPSTTTTYPTSKNNKATLGHSTKDCIAGTIQLHRKIQSEVNEDICSQNYPIGSISIQSPGLVTGVSKMLTWEIFSGNEPERKVIAICKCYI